MAPTVYVFMGVKVPLLRFSRVGSSPCPGNLSSSHLHAHTLLTIPLPCLTHVLQRMLVHV